MYFVTIKHFIFAIRDTQVAKYCIYDTQDKRLENGWIYKT